MNLKKLILSGLAVLVLVPSLSFAADQKDGSERKAEQAQQADQKQAASQANNDNSIPWKKVAANTAALSFGALCNYMGELYFKNKRELYGSDVVTGIACLVTPFIFARKINADWFYPLAGLLLPFQVFAKK